MRDQLLFHPSYCKIIKGYGLSKTQRMGSQRSQKSGFTCENPQEKDVQVIQGHAIVLCINLRV
jgi:hypothetical protein